VTERVIDSLDASILEAVQARPRAGYLELSRLLSVTRATVQARLERMEGAGVVTGYGPDLDLAAAGYPVTAFVTLEIAQGRLAALAAALAEIPSVIEAFAITGPGDVQCRVVARSHEDLQRVLIEMSRLPGVARSTSMIALTRVVQYRAVALLSSDAKPWPARARPRADS
jgi:DNA-binding Lrp family transcriptional regulator